MSFAAASGAPLGPGATRMPGTGVGTQRDVRARSTAPSSPSAPGETSVRLSSQATQPMLEYLTSEPERPGGVTAFK